MKKCNLLLTLIALSVFSVQNAWARVTPELPEAQAPADGQYYYLYNVVEGKFLCKSSTNSYYAGLGTYGDKLLFTSTEEENGYMIRWADKNYLLQAYDTYIYGSSSSASGWRDYFIFAETSNGYTIQRSSKNTNYYKADEFVGFNGSNGDRLSPALTEGSIYWKVFTAEDVERYHAKKALYDALVSADDYSISFAIEEYEALYANDNATKDELTAAANKINESLIWHDRLANGESEYPIYIQMTGNAGWYTSSGNYSYSSIVNGQGGLKATVEVDQDATLVYRYSNGYCYGHSFNVYLDGELYQNINNYEGFNEGNNGTGIRSRMFYLELTPGKHTIEWEAKSTDENNATKFYLYDIAAYKTPTITVNLTQAGSLGTEVLYNVDHIKDVRKLVVKGHMNSDDWEKINMMSNLFELDLTETTVESLPQIDPSQFFHKIALPAGLKVIEYNSLRGRLLDEITFPETLTTIGEYALYATRIKEALIPQSVTSIGNYAFAKNHSLQKVVWPQQVKSVPDYCFSGDNVINDFVLPEGITSIGKYAFYDNYYCNYKLPSTVTYIGEYSFVNAEMIESLYIPDNCSVEWNAFQSCDRLTYVKIGEGVTFWWYNQYYNTFRDCWRLEEIEFPTSFCEIRGLTMLSGCTALKKVVLKSPTLIGGDYLTRFFDGLSTDIQVFVPSYLVNAYKLDPYWYNYNIMGFDSADQKNWILRNPLVLNEGQRMGGTPNIDMQQQGSLTFNGDTPQIIDNLTFCKDWYDSGDWNTMLLSNTNNVNISGKLTYRAYTPEKKWAFLCLPFDTKVSDITSESSFAIRYYDGARRATNGTGGNWKNYEPDDIIPAGTGFILQTSKKCSTFFTALDNASKKNVLSYKEFVKDLDANHSDVTANKGWNLVGNPWATYYNIHKLNFTAPITVWNGAQSSPTYVAYSIIDDDYAIKPLEAIFVQCPDEVNSISFPIDGRQLTTKIESQNGAPARNPQNVARKLIDVELTNGNMTDKTRFVLNPQASTDYEISCDASKFFSMDSSVPQIYTIEQGTQLAINERPLDEGTVQIGIRLAADGAYTLSAPRCQFKRILLIDMETGVSTDLALGGSYTFTGKAGTDNSRFLLRVDDTTITEIDEVDADQTDRDVFFNLSGQRISHPQKGVYIKNGKKVIIK